MLWFTSVGLGLTNGGETPTGSFNARLRVIGQTGFPVPVVLDLTDEQLTVTTDSGRLGHERGPEDWVGSLTELPASMLGQGHPPDLGVSWTEFGASFRDIVRASAVDWLGPRLSEAFGGESGLLVKLLDAGERLPVHCHPTRPFASKNLNSPFGKTEGWVILHAEKGAKVWLGMKLDIPMATFRGWIEEQDSSSMLAAMNEVEVEPGQVLYIKAGVPHSIGPGVMLTELQEPSSLSILAEYENFGLDETRATLNLGWEMALSCFDLSGYGGRRMRELMPGERRLANQSGGSVHNLFAAEVAQFFSALRVVCSGTVHLDEPTFAILVVTRGSGRLRYDSGSLEVQTGETWVVPYGAGILTLSGDPLEVIVCLPPQL